MFLPAQFIRERCDPKIVDEPMIEPFSERTQFDGTSYGLSGASYDLRIDRDIELWPGRSVRADAIEYIRMPKDLVGLLFTKSTWARVHIEHSGTLIDPGFRGYLRLEINYHHGNDIQRIKAGTGIVQVVFGLLLSDTVQPYCKNDKYQNQARDQDAIFRIAANNV